MLQFLNELLDAQMSYCEAMVLEPDSEHSFSVWVQVPDAEEATRVGLTLLALSRLLPPHCLWVATCSDTFVITASIQAIAKTEQFKATWLAMYDCEAPTPMSHFMNGR